MNGFFLNDADMIQIKIVRVCFTAFDDLRDLFTTLVIILVPPVQSILPNTSSTVIDESAATSDVRSLILI